MLRHSNGDSAVKTSFSFSRNTDLEPPRLPEFPSVVKNFENRPIVLAFLLQDEGEGKMREGIKAMSRLYKSESSKLAKIVQVATVSISSEEARPETLSFYSVRKQIHSKGEACHRFLKNSSRIVFAYTEIRSMRFRKRGNRDRRIFYRYSRERSIDDEF